MKTVYLATCVVAVLVFASGAEAELHGRLPVTPGGTDYQAYYDDQLNITWLSIANLSGVRNRGEHMAFLSTLVIGGVEGWRLPSIDVNGDGVVVDCSSASAKDCLDSEYGYMFFQNGVTHGAPEPFTGVVPQAFWSSTPITCCSGWAFSFVDGSIGSNTFAKSRRGWGVRDGDVTCDISRTIELSSSMQADYAIVGGTPKDQIVALNQGPNGTETWQPVNRMIDNHANASFECSDPEFSPPLAQPYISANQFLVGADEITATNCDSAFYRIKFVLPEGCNSIVLTGDVNVDDQGTLFINGNRIAPEIDIADFGDDLVVAGSRVLTWPTLDPLGTDDETLFRGGVNELIFAVAGDQSVEPTGLEFTGNIRASLVLSDTDGDGLSDSADNCTVTPNPQQRDTNDDGIGNACDPDLNNDCTVNFEDLSLMQSVFFGVDDDADFDGDGIVNFVDLVTMQALFFSEPGPSGIPNDCGAN